MTLTPQDLTPEERQRIEKLLLEGEVLKWVQKPQPRLFSIGTIANFIFSLVWLGFIAFWTTFALQASLLFAAFSIPFWLIGIGLFFTPWIQKSALKRSLYIITNKRALNSSISFFGTQKNLSWPIEAGMVRTSVIRKDGNGDLVFDEEELPHNSRNQRPKARGFLCTPDALEVQKLLSKLAEEQANTD